MTRVVLQWLRGKWQKLIQRLKEHKNHEKKSKGEQQRKTKCSAQTISPSSKYKIKVKEEVEQKWMLWISQNQQPYSLPLSFMTF